MGTWITRLVRQKEKCKEAGVNIDDERMVLTITSNAMKCLLFAQQDHKGYNDLATKDFATCHCEDVLGEEVQSTQEVQSPPIGHE
jgi:hypothetical protein